MFLSNGVRGRDCIALGKPTGSQITVTGTLLDGKADPNFAPPGQFTPLQLAARTDQAAMCGFSAAFCLSAKGNPHDGFTDRACALETS